MQMRSWPLFIALGIWGFAFYSFSQQPDAMPSRPGERCPPGVRADENGLPDMDCSTLDILIRHERYTITLLQNMQKQAQRAELKALIQQMSQDHGRQVLKLNALRKEWYGASL